ncbi:MAG: 4Fe-4S binding protein [Chloroflexota bacterium]
MKNEGSMEKAVPEIDTAQCDGCGTCVELCPGGAAELRDGKAVVVRPEDCTYCTECEVLCPTRAIRCDFDIILADTGISD